MNFKIRDAKVTDAEAIWKLNTEEMGYSFSLEATKAKLFKLLSDVNNRIFVAVADGIVVGYIHANGYELLFAPSMRNVMAIAVSSAYKRNGIGRALLTEVEQWAVESGSTGVRLVSGETRVSAHEFYRSCGYVSNKKQLNFKKMI
ncbi:MAG: GNAT family N-acetyltransferase [Clostridia bacterium]|nr:GNAT family N-acetyltransferase [Clostridia bacterium]